ncbi:MAG TPA: acyltransferase family protein [Lacunisphaera sp.]|nr:acyltransferase family protein [Lacunisphaera sp.]
MTSASPALPSVGLAPRVVPAGAPSAAAPVGRLDYLDATRAFALLLGVVFHASLSFSPYFMGWAVQDVATSPLVPDFILVSHSFRMELFFLLAGFFSEGLLRRQGPGGFLRSRAVRLGVPLVAGWFLLRPLLVSGWIMGAASMRGDYHFWAGIRAGFAGLRELPAGLFTGSHLWFLYYLLLATGLLLVARLAVRAAIRAWGGEPAVIGFRSGLDRAAGWLVHSGWGLPLLILPTAAALWSMRFWGMETPDQSLQPNLPVLAIYGGGFALGWMIGRQAPGTMAKFGRITASRVLLLAAGLVASLKLNPIQADPGHPHFVLAHAGFVLGYATLMWTLVALTTGMFRLLCSRPRPLVRYLADSSYWVYLVHLPVVVWLQVAVAEVQLPWSLKLAIVVAATLAIALLTYDLFVRSTWLGQILNGRRRGRVLGELAQHATG